MTYRVLDIWLDYVWIIVLFNYSENSKVVNVDFDKGIWFNRSLPTYQPYMEVEELILVAQLGLSLK